MHFNTKTNVCSAVIYAALLLIGAGHTKAQTQYTVYASLIYARTGEHTPAYKLPAETYRLTPYGAQQMNNMVRLHEAETGT